MTIDLTKRPEHCTTRSPRSIYADLDPDRGARPRPTGAGPQGLRLVPAVEATPPARTSTPPVASNVVAALVEATCVATEPDAEPHPAASALDTYDQNILAVLDGPAAAGESADALYRRKEHELGALFATLPASDAVALAKRLSTVEPGDVLSARFSRLVAERRQRLIDFLGDAKRREAIEKARQPRGASVKGSTP